MAHLGLLSFPGTGHLNPLTGLGRKLQSRGHEVTYFQIADCEPAIRAAGLGYVQIGKEDYPVGSLRKLDDDLGRLKGLKAIRFSVERIRRSAVMMMRDGPDAIRRRGVMMLIVDQAEVGGGTVADHLNLPYVSVTPFIPLHLDPSVPFFGYGWRHGTSPYHRIRNRLGNALFTYTTEATRKTVRAKRLEWGLPALKGVNDFSSRVAQITQTPAAFEFPGRRLPPNFHYTGPWTDPESRKRIDFPWHRLDPNRPLIFASMGTLQNQMTGVFQTIAAACAGLPAQLVLSLGAAKDPRR
jgi:zeaxanthin glucosyltransferase